MPKTRSDVLPNSKLPLLAQEGKPRRHLDSAHEVAGPNAQTILPYNRQCVLCIELQEHRGLRHVDIRLWVGSLKDPHKLTATQKGVKLYPESGRAVVAAISKALDALEADVG